LRTYRIEMPMPGPTHVHVDVSPSVTAELAGLTATLRAKATHYELARAWPTESLDAYTQCRGWGWGLPTSHGGLARSAGERLAGYLALARGDMSTALFVTQHEGAVDLITTCENEALRDYWLPRYATGEALTSIGYSQLTTSRQGGAPAMLASPVENGFCLNGVMPWVTGAPYITNVACGAALDNGEQLLALVAINQLNVRVVPAEILCALNSTHTCEIRCDGVFVPNEDLIAGPVKNVLTQRSALRLLLVSATGVGLALAMLDEIHELSSRPGYGVDADQFRSAGLRTDTYQQRLSTLAQDGELDQDAIDDLRIDLDDWLVRLAGMTLVLAKGTGYREAANAQRLAREAMFFCVWSASSGVRAGTIEHLLGH
jgi:alkylation response protein AidB-like acyl-CoA dehydrogenase